METQKEEKEIDLVKVIVTCFRKLAAFFSVINSWIIWLIRYIYKKKFYVGIGLLCAIVFTAFWARPSHRSYKMETEIRINVIDAYFFNDLVEAINHMCINKDYNSIRHSLNVSPEVAKSLCGINSYFIVDKLCDGTPDEICYDEFNADTTKKIMEDRLIISLTITDSTLIEPIEKGLSYYFASNPYVLQNNKERLSQIDNRINSINKEVMFLDSLRKFDYFKRQHPEMTLNGPLIVSEKDKQLYYNDILQLEQTRDKRAYERAVMSDCVNWARGFVVVRVYNRYVLTFIYSALSFVTLMLILSFFIGEKEKIKNFLNK